MYNEKPPEQNRESRKNTRVVVAMSGGVDSSVAAALLVNQGYDVIGMMLRLWSEPGKDSTNRCCTPDAMGLARKVSSQLGIPFYTIDAQEEFRATVVEEFIDGYASSITPNPCLVCNKVIRWQFLLQHALAIGADFSPRVITPVLAEVDRVVFNCCGRSTTRRINRMYCMFSIKNQN
jgi:tRNA-specific 2-thiouridylase